MPEDTSQTDPLYRYVLGQMTEPEQERLEDVVLTDPVQEQALWAVFDEVAERFLQAELPLAESQQFVLRLQASPLLKERVANLQTLLAVVAARQPKPVAATAAPSAWAGWFARWRWQWGALAAATMLVVMGLLWWKRAPVPPREIARQTIPPTTPSPAVPTPSIALTSTPQPVNTPAPSHRQALATFFFPLKAVRDKGQVTPLSIASEVQSVALQLEVPPPLYASYQVTVQTADGRTRTLRNLRSQVRHGVDYVMARFTTTTLGTEPFTVEVAGIAAGQAPIALRVQSLQVEKVVGKKSNR